LLVGVANAEPAMTKTVINAENKASFIEVNVR
jgi:hypothetical protein